MHTAPLNYKTVSFSSWLLFLTTVGKMYRTKIGTYQAQKMFTSGTLYPQLRQQLFMPRSEFQKHQNTYDTES